MKETDKRLNPLASESCGKHFSDVTCLFSEFSSLLLWLLRGDWGLRFPLLGKLPIKGWLKVFLWDTKCRGRASTLARHRSKHSVIPWTCSFRASVAPGSFLGRGCHLQPVAGGVPFTRLYPQGDSQSGLWQRESALIMVSLFFCLFGEYRDSHFLLPSGGLSKIIRRKRHEGWL